MQTEGRIIYVAGNPNFYPLEFYDTESKTYQGVIPEFLTTFAQRYGYDLRYFQPGEEDCRTELAENRQVDLISGSALGEQYSHTTGEPLILFSSQEDGTKVTYALFLSDVSSLQVQADLRTFTAQISQEEWTGAILKSTHDMPPLQTLPETLWSAGLLILAFLIAAMSALIWFRREKRYKKQGTWRDLDSKLETIEGLEKAFAIRMGHQSSGACSLICIHLNLDQVGRLWGYERAKTLSEYGVQVLRQAAGPEDVLARCGEDLLVLKCAIQPQKAVRWADQAVGQIRSRLEGGLCLQAVAAGVYSLADPPYDFSHGMFHVQQCAREACRQGQPVRMCETEQCQDCRERWNLLEDFCKALDRNEFQLYVQFFVDATTFRIVGGEALSRWYHPRFGLLSPARYIPLLEETGQIEALDFYGLEKACDFLEELGRRQVRDFFISCNFARKTFCAPGFAQRCMQVIQRYSFPQKLLILEITESQQMDRLEMEQLRQNILEIRESGIRVIFDDFGVGFSSFRDLQSCPMDGLKLDKELVDHMQTEKGKIILNSLVEIGHRMGLTILAEGVEEEGQIAMLQELHCDAFQGFRFSVPLPELEARKRILSGSCTWKDRGHGQEGNLYVE